MAKLDLKGRSKEEIVALLSVRQDINEVRLLKGEEVVAQNNFPPKPERYFYDGKDISNS